jgi:hypothetical protein
VQQGSEDLPGSLKSQDSVRERIESRRVPKQMDPFKEYYLVENEPSAHLGAQSVAGLLLSCGNMNAYQCKLHTDKAIHDKEYVKPYARFTDFRTANFSFKKRREFRKGDTYVSKMRRSYASGIVTFWYRIPYERSSSLCSVAISNPGFFTCTNSCNISKLC